MTADFLELILRKLSMSSTSRVCRSELENFAYQVVRPNRRQRRSAYSIFDRHLEWYVPRILLKVGVRDGRSYRWLLASLACAAPESSASS